MAEKAKKMFRNPNTVIGMAAVLLVAILCQSSSAEAPALAYISEEFGGMDFSTITLVSTVPSIMMIPASLAYSFLRKRFSFRALFIVAAILLIVGGVAPAWTPHDPNAFTFIIAWRAVFGLGCGVMWPLAQSMIVELYEGTRQNTLLGFNSVVTACGGILWSNIGGILALHGWRISFYTYAVPIVILIFCGIFLPHSTGTSRVARLREAVSNLNNPEVEVADQSASAPSVRPKGFIIAAVLLLFFYFMYNFCNMTYFTNLSMKIVGEGIGDSAMAGVVQSVFTVGTLVIGLTFGKIMQVKAMDKFSMFIGWIITGIGMIIVSKATGFTGLAVGSLIQGFGTGLFMPTMVALIGNLGGKSNASMILGISTCVLGASQYFGPTIFNVLAESMGLTAGGPCMFMAAIGHVVFAVVVFIWLLVKGKPNFAGNEEELPAETA